MHLTRRKLKVCYSSSLVECVFFFVATRTSQWLYSDGLFGSKWCIQNGFQDHTGCDLVRAKEYLLIKHSQTSSSEPNIQRAVHIIEDTLLNFLGASESRCILLYDLQMAYCPHPVDGIVKIRNPLNSDELVWAKAINLTIHRRWRGVLGAKAVTDYCHRLRCTLKICVESFGVKMHNGHPYVMICGFNRNKVANTVEFVEKRMTRWLLGDQFFERSEDLSRDR